MLLTPLLKEDTGFTDKQKKNIMEGVIRNPSPAVPRDQLTTRNKLPLSSPH